MAQRLFHILNRGVEKRKIFLEEKEYVRFIHDLNDFNNPKKVDLPYYDRKKGYYSKKDSYHLDVRRPGDRGVNDKLVDILCWTLLPNHVHLMTEEIDDETGVSEFTRKVFGGYTKYFNEKYDRSGVLFQGRTKIKKVDSNAHFLYLPFYVHLNIIDVFQPDWREVGINDPQKAIEFAETYRWSNYRDIIGKGNGEFAHITNKELFFEMFQTNEKQYKKAFEDWVKSRKYLNKDFSVFE